MNGREAALDLHATFKAYVVAADRATRTFVDYKFGDATEWQVQDANRREQEARANHAAAIVAALDTPAPAPEPGAYPCCGQCDPGCSGRHENPCPRCQAPTASVMRAIADEGAAVAKARAAGGAW